MKEKTGPETKLQLLTQMAQVRRKRRDQTKKVRRRGAGTKDGGVQNAELRFSDQNQILVGGKTGEWATLIKVFT